MDLQSIIDHGFAVVDKVIDLRVDLTHQSLDVALHFRRCLEDLTDDLQVLLNSLEGLRSLFNVVVRDSTKGISLRPQILRVLGVDELEPPRRHLLFLSSIKDTKLLPLEMGECKIAVGLVIGESFPDDLSNRHAQQGLSSFISRRQENGFIVLD